MTTARRFIREAVENIYVPPNHRPAHTDAVEALAGSMKELGLLVPILVRYRADEVVMEDGEVVDTAYHLVAGRHRLEAAKLLGWEEIECETVKGTDRRIRMMEIAENLHRNDLTVLERQEQTAEYLRLSDEENAETDTSDILVQHAPKLGRPEGGSRAAERKLGIEHTQAQRATKIDALPPEVKAEAKVLHLDDNQRALLKAAKAPSKEEQLRVLREEAAKRADKSEVSASERRIEAAVNAVKKLSEEELAVFKDWFLAYCEDGGAVFDKTATGARLVS